MKAVVAARGQVTIPKRLRERLGIRPGTVLEFREEAERLVAEKAETAAALDRWFGRLGRRRRTDDIIRALRGEPRSRPWIRAPLPTSWWAAMLSSRRTGC